MEALKEIGVPIFAITIMLSVGVDLTFQQVLAIFRKPKALLIGLFLNHLIVPFVAFGLSKAFLLSLPVATGFLLCASAPGGPMGVMLTQRARGDLALGVSMLVVMTAINTITVPLLLILFLGAGLEGDALGHASSIASTIIVYLLIPLAVGMAVRHWLPKLAARALPILMLTTNLLFAGLSIAMYTKGQKEIMELGFTPFIAMVLCVLFSLVAGYFAVKASREVRIALALNSGIRNLSLSLLLCTIWFDDEVTLMTVLTYGLVQIGISFASALWIRSR